MAFLSPPRAASEWGAKAMLLTKAMPLPKTPNDPALRSARFTMSACLSAPQVPHPICNSDFLLGLGVGMGLALMVLSMLMLRAAFGGMGYALDGGAAAGWRAIPREDVSEPRETSPLNDGRPGRRFRLEFFGVALAVLGALVLVLGFASGGNAAVLVGGITIFLGALFLLRTLASVPRPMWLQNRK